MTAPDRTPGSPDHQKQPESGERSGWWVALLAIPVLCCAGPALLAAIGVGSVSVLAGGLTGATGLIVIGLLAVGVAIALAWRRSRH